MIGWDPGDFRARPREWLVAVLVVALLLAVLRVVGSWLW